MFADEELCNAIEEYRINAQQDPKKRARIMIDEFGWEKTDCMKIWGFGPADIGIGGANIIVDQTKGMTFFGGRRICDRFNHRVGLVNGATVRNRLNPIIE